jgi:glycosyltransferase involved in cell wall biosynthesis
MHLQASGESALAPINVVYVGPLDARHHVHALADAFMAARDHDHRLHLLVAGDGDERACVERQLGHAVTFLDPFGDARLDQLIGEADLLVCPTTSPDTAETIMAAQRGGLPVLAVDGGDAATLIENGRSGFLVPDDTAALADAIRWLCRRATLRERLAIGGRLAAGTRQASGPGRIMTA